MNYSAQIEQAVKTIDEIDRRVEEIKLQLDRIDDNLLLGVLADLNPDGKLKYTNDKMREVAHRIAQRDSDHYTNAWCLWRSAVTDKALAKARLERLRNDCIDSRIDKIRAKDLLAMEITHAA